MAVLTACLIVCVACKQRAEVQHSFGYVISVRSKPKNPVHC